MEKLELEHTEALVAAQQRVSADAGIQQQLDEAVADKTRMEKELLSAKERLERAKKDNVQVNMLLNNNFMKLCIYLFISTM